MTNMGIWQTMPGIIIVERMMANRTFCPTNLQRTNANAVKVAASGIKITLHPTTMSEFLKKIKNFLSSAVT